MTITLGHALLGVFISAAVLVGIFFFTAKSTRPLFPVRCVHCWMYNQKNTVITLSEQPGLWGICPDCVELYWHFSESEPQEAGSGLSDQLARASEASLVH